MKSDMYLNFRKRNCVVAVFLLVVMGVPVVFSLRLLNSPQLSLSGSPSITYDSDTNTITVSGYLGANPCTFSDVWQADQGSGWGVVGRQGTCQFLLGCKLQIGDGITETYFNDTSVQVVFAGGICTENDQNLMLVKARAYLTLGAVISYAAKSTENGCTIYNMEQTYRVRIIQGAGANTYLYSCSFYSVRNVGKLNTIDTIWNCFCGDNIDIEACENDVYNVLCISPTVGVRLMPSCTFDKMIVVNANGQPYSAVLRRWGNGDCRVSNVLARNNSLILSCGGVTQASRFYLVNVDSDAWGFSFSSGDLVTVLRQYEFDLTVTASNNSAISNANVTLWDNSEIIGSWLSNSSGRIPTHTLTMGSYNTSGGNAIFSANPFMLNITASGYQEYTQTFNLYQKTDWTIALLPQTGDEMIGRNRLTPIDPNLTSPSGTYRWLDVADQAYSIGYQNSYNYSQAAVEVDYCKMGNRLQGLLTAKNLKPNFAYQLKLVGTPGTEDNERIGLAGRWWEEVWNGTAWTGGQNLNDKGNGSSPNPNDETYFIRRLIQDNSSPTGYHYRYTGYLVFDYFITNNKGDATLCFETGSSYHVLWKTSQRSNSTNDGPVETVTFDPNPSEPAYDTDYPNNTVSIFGEWERLPMGNVKLQAGEYNCQLILTEESFHGSGGSLGGNWAGALSAMIIFTIGN